MAALGPSLVMVVVAAALTLVTLRRKTLRAKLWRATVTPLASIIGSGFLVAGPLLAHVAGNWAWAAMLALCLAGYVFGSAIRHNIRVVEPILATSPPPALLVIERASDLALVLAYFVSVAYYLYLFAAFGLRAVGIVDPVATRWLCSLAIGGIGLVGAVRGFGALERVETGAVGLKLALIGGLLAALGFAVAVALSRHAPLLSGLHGDGSPHGLAVLLGLVILVQGFETSRYLGAEYDAQMRIRTMRYAQLLATAVYLAFILLLTPQFTGGLPEVGGETAVIDMLAPLGAAVGPLLILAALTSQLSAAVADMAGAGGLLHDATRGHVATGLGYAATASVALVIVWSAGIFEIIVYASKAFVLYYALQSGLAAWLALRPGTARHFGRGALFCGATLLAVAVLLFGVPAEGS